MLKRVMTFVFGFVLFAAAMHAQTGVVQIQGTVSDSSGAVAPNATIALEHVQTGNKFQTTSSEVGFYVFPSLQPREYRRTGSLRGMGGGDGQMTVQVGQRAVVDPTLQVARGAGQVTVAGDVTPLIMTTRPTV